MLTETRLATSTAARHPKDTGVLAAAEVGVEMPVADPRRRLVIADDRHLLRGLEQVGGSWGTGQCRAIGEGNDDEEPPIKERFVAIRRDRADLRIDRAAVAGRVAVPITTPNPRRLGEGRRPDRLVLVNDRVLMHIRVIMDDRLVMNVMNDCGGDDRFAAAGLATLRRDCHKCECERQGGQGDQGDSGQALYGSVAVHGKCSLKRGSTLRHGAEA